LPLELQAKLLRILQDGEFERLGSSRTIKVDVRVIAATNRNLEAEIQSGRFREDLFYRLNAYPLSITPLRERPDDIPLLVQAFVKRFSKKLGKSIERIPRSTMQALQRYAWPGNVRELQNVIERAIITAPDNTLRVELAETSKPVYDTETTLEGVERDYIQHILEVKDWKIEGPQGAAAALGLHPSTLRFRMKKLGIKRP
jgi:chemotaxis protein methyltransferase CheR